MHHVKRGTYLSFKSALFGDKPCLLIGFAFPFMDNIAIAIDSHAQILGHIHPSKWAWAYNPMESWLRYSVCTKRQKSGHPGEIFIRREWIRMPALPVCSGRHCSSRAGRGQRAACPACCGWCGLRRFAARTSQSPHGRAWLPSAAPCFHPAQSTRSLEGCDMQGFQLQLLSFRWIPDEYHAFKGFSSTRNEIPTDSGCGPVWAYQSKLEIMLA